MGLSVYIMTDLEGVSGVLLEAQTLQDGPAYELARHWLTTELNASIAGAFEAGADRVVAVDGHGKPFNFVYEELDERAEYIVGSGWEFYPEGAACDFDCAFCIGFHAMAGTPHAVLDHTMSSATWQNCWINGQLVGELAIVAGILGELGVPVTLVSGDEAACSEARELLGPVETVVTKYGISRHTAKLRAQGPVLEELREKARLAVTGRSKVSPLVFDVPVELKIEYTKTAYADGLRSGLKERPEPRMRLVKGETLGQAFLNLH